MSKIAIPPSATSDGSRLEDRLRVAGHEIVVTSQTDPWSEADLHEQTRNMIGARELALMKPSAILINTSRGGAVVEQDLADALLAGRLAGAALDVFQQEPIEMHNPLLRCDPDRVILTPHAIGHNLETGPPGVQMALDNIERALRGDLPESVVNPQIAPAWRRRMAMLH